MTNLSKKDWQQSEVRHQTSEGSIEDSKMGGSPSRLTSNTDLKPTICASPTQSQNLRGSEYNQNDMQHVSLSIRTKMMKEGDNSGNSISKMPTMPLSGLAASQTSLNSPGFSGLAQHLMLDTSAPHMFAQMSTDQQNASDLRRQL